MIHRIENNAIAETASLPYITGPSSCQTVQAVCDITGQDWRAETLPTLQPWQEYGGYIIGATVSREVVDKPIETEMLDAIDVAAGAGRVRLVSPGDLVLEEYRLAAIDAQAFKAAGYTGTVPAGVSTWAVPKGWTDQQAADDIIYTQALWTGASNQLRALRLSGKEAVRSATTSQGKWNAAQNYIGQLNALYGG